MDSITTRTAKIYIVKPGFVRMDMFENVIQDLQDMMNNHKAENEITNGVPHVILIDTRLNSMSDNEARRFSSGDIPTKYRYAVALLFEGLPGRIGANSLIKNYQPKVRTQTFDNEQKAVEWLEHILKENSQ
jgi:hypothetical protein